MNNNEKTIPIFYACDNNFVKYTFVSIKSLIENSSEEYNYNIYILNSNICEETKKFAKEFIRDNVNIKFVNVEEQIKSIKKNMPIRDYYSLTTYYRFLIAELFPQYNKAIYIDSDTIVLGDISELFNKNLMDNYVGACNEQVMIQTDVFGECVEKVLGIERSHYFNAGVLLLNTKMLRTKKILERFIKILDLYTFSVTQDQDYLNVLCKGKVLFLDQSWNTEVYGNIVVKEADIKILHYIMTSKPWHYKGCRLKEYFWEYAKKTSLYYKIFNELENYSEEQKLKDKESCDNLVLLAKNESSRIDTYKNLISNKNVYRLKVLEKIRQYNKKLSENKELKRAV